MKNVFAVLRSKGFKVASVFSALAVASTAAHADIAASIGTAQAEAETNVGLAIVAVIAIAALVMGLGIITGLIKR